MAAAIPAKISKWVDVAVSVGAAVIIWGALQKITHAPSADKWLFWGMATETVIFLIYAALYAIYPAVKDSYNREETLGVSSGGAVLGSLDKAMVQADITPANLNMLGENFKKLNSTITNMSQIGDVVKVTGDYTTRTTEVTAALAKVKDAYIGAANSVGAFNQASEGAKIFNDQMQVMTKNLGSLNAIYELELKESNNHVKALNNAFGKLSETSATMAATADDAKKMQQEVGALAGNLGRLNNVYGNMLSAMQGGGAARS